MKTIATILVILTGCLLSAAREITILPQFVLGDTLKYRMTAQMTMHIENDSIVIMSNLLPQLIVEEKNDEGFVISTTNKLELYNAECSAQKLKELPSAIAPENDYIESVRLKIQLDRDCHPDTILNLDAVRDNFVAYVKQQQGDDYEDSPEQEMLTKAIASMMCTPKRLIDQQFGNIPYFNFLGIPLESGKIPASMVLSDDLQKKCHEVTELEMEVISLGNTIELNMSEDDGFYAINLKGAKEKTKIEGKLLYAGGIIAHGLLSFKTDLGPMRLAGNFILDAIR